MNEIVTTDAIVLKSMKYRETSRIVNFYTRQFGKISGIVKGARSPKSKFGASLEPMSLCSLVFYKKEGRDLHTVSQCDTLKFFPHLAADIEKMSVGVSIIELINIVAHEEEENIPLFELAVNMLTTLNDATKNPLNLLYAFEVRIARVMGFQPLFDKCISCRTAVFFVEGREKSVEYHLDKGGPLCHKCTSVAGHKTKLTPRVFRILERLTSSTDLVSIVNIEVDDRSRSEIETFLRSFLNYHVSGMRPLKSEKVFSKIMAAS